MSGIEACDTCHAGLVSRWRWKKFTGLQRRAAIADGFRAKNKAGQCDRCALAVRRTEIAAVRRAAAEQAHAVRLEDLRWMAETGESLAGAAARLGLTQDGVQKFLKKANERGLMLTLLRRNPVDPNAPWQASAARETLLHDWRTASEERVA